MYARAWSAARTPRSHDALRRLPSPRCRCHRVARSVRCPDDPERHARSRRHRARAEEEDAHDVEDRRQRVVVVIVVVEQQQRERRHAERDVVVVEQQREQRCSFRTGAGGVRFVGERVRLLSVLRPDERRRARHRCVRRVCVREPRHVRGAVRKQLLQRPGAHGRMRAVLERGHGVQHEGGCRVQRRMQGRDELRRHEQVRRQALIDRPAASRGRLVVAYVSNVTAGTSAGASSRSR